MKRTEFKKHILPFRDKLYRFAKSLMADASEAEDVVQEVFIKVWRQLQDGRQIDHPEAWCMRLTRNLAIDKLRSRRRRQNGLDGQPEPEDAGASPHLLAENNDTMHSVRQALKTLSEKQRLVFQLRDIEGMSYNDISKTLSIPLNQVKVDLHRARNQIRQYLLKKESYGLPRN